MERITITFNQDGSFRGASVTDFDGLPQAVDKSALAAVAPAINAATLAKSVESDAIIAKLESLKTTMVQKVQAALQSGDPAQFQALAVEFLTPEQDKQRAEKLAQLEALKAELGVE